MNDLHEDYLVKFLEYKCEKYSIEPSRVYLELVEDIILCTSKAVDEQIGRLKQSGFHVIVDDFGTDKSAYSRMFDLEAEYIKIDGTFIKKLLGNKEQQLIVKSIIDFAKKSNIKTIAEHVETEEIYKIVKELGVDYSQGFYIGKPSLTLE
jgi:EAL domain-containing protein (putative c-di-GMP-specific phosphodiesterase class I)